MSAGGRRVWVLNLDSELELEGLGRGRDVLRAARQRPEVVEWLQSSVVPAGDAVVSTLKERHVGARGFAFSPTPRALAALDAVGAFLPEPVPSVEILRRVASRAFSASLGLLLPGAVFASSASEVEVAVRRAPGPSSWLLRRPFGLAGGGRCIVPPGELSVAAQAFVAKALESGGVLVEPFVTRIADFALHGYVDGEEVVIGEPTLSRVDDRGVWRGSERAASSDLRTAERDGLAAEALRVGKSLEVAGYRGPFGVDAFRYAWGGDERFSPRCEINARYSMGWGIGMGSSRPDLDRYAANTA